MHRLADLPGAPRRCCCRPSRGSGLNSSRPCRLSILLGLPCPGRSRRTSFPDWLRLSRRRACRLPSDFCLPVEEAAFCRDRPAGLFAPLCSNRVSSLYCRPVCRFVCRRVWILYFHSTYCFGCRRASNLYHQVCRRGSILPLASRHSWPLAGRPGSCNSRTSSPALCAPAHGSGHRRFSSA